MKQILKIGQKIVKQGKILKMEKFQKGAKIKKLRGARHTRMKCASSTRDLVPESARLLQMSRTQKLRSNTRDLPEACQYR